MRALLPFLIFLVSCTSDEPEFKPLLEHDVFKTAVKEGLLIEARANKERVELKRDSIPIRAYYEEMYASLSISEADFKTTFDQYVAHPEAFKDLFDEIAAELQIEVDSLERSLNPAQ